MTPEWQNPLVYNTRQVGLASTLCSILEKTPKVPFLFISFVMLTQLQIFLKKNLFRFLLLVVNISLFVDSLKTLLVFIFQYYIIFLCILSMNSGIGWWFWYLNSHTNISFMQDFSFHCFWVSLECFCTLVWFWFDWWLLTHFVLNLNPRTLIFYFKVSILVRCHAFCLFLFVVFVEVSCL